MLLNKKTDKMIFTPRGNNVLLERLVGGDMSAGGIAIPPKYVENPLMAKVLAIGPGEWVASKFYPIEGLEIGDIVFFNIKQAIPCERDPNSRLCFVDADHIISVVSIEPILGDDGCIKG